METFAFFINNKKINIMRLKNFSSFIKPLKVSENSDLDWSDKNWDERGIEGENPPINGLEGSSAFQADYYAGDYGETGEESDEESDEVSQSDRKINAIEIERLKAMIDDLTERVKRIE